MALDLEGVACATGSACSSGSMLPSPVLKAMRVSEDVLRSAVRLSFGGETSMSDVETASQVIAKCVQRQRL
jgi:cysteine desulfurase